LTATERQTLSEKPSRSRTIPRSPFVCGGTDVELKELADGKRVASFVLAVDRASKDGGADFVRISVWDRQAELCQQFLHKGDRAALDGRLRSRSWEAPDGTRRSAVEVVANRVQFPSSRTGDDSATTTPFEEAAVS
jgi:single-strand DNA-binding protein